MATAWDAALDELLGPDTTRPVITLVGANPQTVEVGRAYVELGATATDNVDGDLSDAIVIDASAVDTGSPGSYSVTYNVSDSSGNDAVQKVRTVQVVEVPVPDTTRPVITLVGANPQTVEVGRAYVELGATATDNVDGDLSDEIVIDASAVDTGSPGSYSVTYNVSDSSGNDAVQKVRTVQVVEVPVPPVGGGGGVGPTVLPVVIVNSCPDTIPAAGFTDLGGLSGESKHAVDCLVLHEISQGTSTDTFSPLYSVTRWQMAMFLTRQLTVHGVSLPVAIDQSFSDIGDLPTATKDAINRLASLGITKGTGETTYDPGAPVSRWQMAFFLTRLLAVVGVSLETSPPSQFLDIGDLPASTQLVVNQLVAAQIINGTSATTFNPHADVLRWHMSLFLTRVLSAGGVTLE